jgi:hypothetical protein
MFVWGFLAGAVVLVFGLAALPVTTTDKILGFIGFWKKS